MGGNDKPSFDPQGGAHHQEHWHRLQWDGTGQQVGVTDGWVGGCMTV